MTSYRRSVISALACVAFFLARKGRAGALITVKQAARALPFAVCCLGVAACFGAAADRVHVQAQVLDHAEFLCSNCFFGASDYYYCFAAADNSILIGYQRTPVLNWRDKSKNYLTRVHPGWTAWTPPDQSLAISYDDKHIWVSRTEGKDKDKELRLTRSAVRDIFTNDDRCGGKAVKAQ
jgi:hypothetical protein